MGNNTESSRDLQALLDAAVDGIIVVNHLGTIQAFNQSAERLFGYQACEVIGQNVGLLMTSEDREVHHRHLTAYLAGRAPHIIGRGREVMIQRKDGTVLGAFLSIGVTADSDPPRFIGLIRDFTAQREAQEAALRLQERLMHVSRLATVGEMASGIAHELNQPLAAIATYAHACDRLLGVGEPDVEEVQTALREIAQQAVRAADVIRRLRGLSRSELGQHRPTGINAMLAELTGLIESDAAAHGASYRAEFAADLPEASVDAPQIQQVILNLVHNALEALALGQAANREVTIRTCASLQEIEIRVCDNGPGIDPAIAERMFDPFCSTKRKGTGLGLAISRTIIEAHSGTLHYRPNVPSGACFIICLPVTARADPAKSIESARPPGRLDRRV